MKNWSYIYLYICITIILVNSIALSFIFALNYFIKGGIYNIYEFIISLIIFIVACILLKMVRVMPITDNQKTGL